MDDADHDADSQDEQQRFDRDYVDYADQGLILRRMMTTIRGMTTAVVVFVVIIMVGSAAMMAILTIYHDDYNYQHRFFSSPCSCASCF